MRKKLEEYSNKEKIEWFDKMYRQAQDNIEEFKKEGVEPKDCDHYAWEEMMLLLGEDIFKEWNSVEVVAER